MIGDLICPFWTDDPGYCLDIWQWLFMIGLFVACYLVISIGWGWLIRAIQMTIFVVVSVSFSKISTAPNGLVSGLFGMAAAYVLTVWPLFFIDWFKA